MRLHAAPADPREIEAALPAVLDGSRPLALGFAPGPEDEAPDGTAVVIATSGSSGIPKRVVIGVAALRASAAATEARIGAGQWMLALPAGYVAGLQVLVRSALAGTRPVMLDGRFTPDAFVQATSVLGSGARRHTSLVPAQLITLLQAAEERQDVRAALAAYDAVLVGGQSLPAPVRERAEDGGVRVVRTYGSSETSGGCVYDGAPLDGVRVEARDGELRIAGPMLATGYLGDAERTAAGFVTDEEGTRWYRTGDAGEVVDGEVRVTGRLDNVLISGGINVSLDRVERIVRGVAGLESAVVVAVADDRWGEASCVVTDQAPADVDAALAQVRALVAAGIGPHARPARIVVLPALPLLPSGKPDRLRIRGLLGD